MKSLLRTHDPDFAKGVFAGIAGGLFASFLMEQFQAFWTKAAKDFESGKKEEKSDEEPATVKMAQAISEGLMRRKLSESKKPFAGEAVHYAMGAASGAIYGLAAEIIPLATVGDGLAFGASVWLAADEGIVPALGLAKSPRQTPPSAHVYAFASHLVYGLVTEAVRRAFRRML